MLAVTVSDARHLPLVRELLMAQTYWRWRSFKVDLIVLNQEGASYDLPLRQQLLRQIEAHSSETGMDRPGGVFLRDWVEHSGGSPRSVPERAERGSERQSRFPAATTGQRRGEPRAAGVCPVGRRAGGPLPAAAFPGTALLQWARRIHAGWPRVCDLSETRQRHARAVGERHGQPRLRHHGDRERTRMHVARQQPDEPADSVA